MFGQNKLTRRSHTITGAALFFVAAIVVALVTAAGPVQAAGIQPARSEHCAHRIDGQIGRGDSERIIGYLQTALDRVDQYQMDDPLVLSPFSVCLNSPGGSLSEATRIAAFLLEKWIGTVVDDGDSCLSACSIIFLMGSTDGDLGKGLNRKLHVNATLGLHRPSVDAPDGAGFSGEQLSKAFDLANEAIYRFMALANTPLGLTDGIFVQPDLMQNMLQHKGQDFFYVDTVGKALRWQIDLFGYEKTTLVDAVAAARACHNMFTVSTSTGKDLVYDYETYTQDQLMDGVTTFHAHSANDGYSGFHYEVHAAYWDMVKSGCRIGVVDLGEGPQMSGCGGSWSGADNFPGNDFCLISGPFAPDTFDMTGSNDAEVLALLMGKLPAFAIYPLETTLRDLPDLARKTRARIVASPDLPRMLAALGFRDCAESDLCKPGERAVSAKASKPDSRNWQRIVGVASNDVLWIRSCESSKCNKVGSLAPGQSDFYITECDGGWCKVFWSDDSFAGWSSKRYMEAR